MITLEMYFMGRDKETPEEVTEEILNNANLLLERINALLAYIGIKDAKISSGWRNSKVLIGSPKSAHKTGQAIDIIDDKDQSLCKKLLENNNELLIKFDLYMENADYTKGKWTNWCHLQTRATKSGNRVFIP